MAGPLDDKDRDLLARTIVGEAANQPFEGQQAVAAVILNRLREGRFGATISDVVLAPHQFEPWQTRRAELQALAPNSPAYVRAVQAIDAASAQDNTNGATHFLEPTIVRQRRGGTLPGWAQGESTQIGDHLFFKPGGGGPTGRSQPAAPAQAATELPTPYAVPGAPTRSPQNLTETFEAADRSGLEPLTAIGKSTQINPIPAFSGASDVDDGVFQPRTTRRNQRTVRKA